MSFIFSRLSALLWIQSTSERGPDVMTEGDQDTNVDSIVLTNDGTPLGVHIISKIEQEDGRYVICILSTGIHLQGVG